MPIEDLFGDGLKVINIGLESFATGIRHGRGGGPRGGVRRPRSRPV